MRIAPGEQESDTAVMALGGLAVTMAEAYLATSCVEVALIVATPATAGVKTPALLTEPMEAGVTDHVTALL